MPREIEQHKEVMYAQLKAAQRSAEHGYEGHFWPQAYDASPVEIPNVGKMLQDETLKREIEGVGLSIVSGAASGLLTFPATQTLIENFQNMGNAEPVGIAAAAGATGAGIAAEVWALRKDIAANPYSLLLKLKTRNPLKSAIVGQVAGALQLSVPFDLIALSKGDPKLLVEGIAASFGASALWTFPIDTFIATGIAGKMLNEVKIFREFSKRAKKGQTKLEPETELEADLEAGELMMAEATSALEGIADPRSIPHTIFEAN